jgi:hypothetical protein
LVDAAWLVEITSEIAALATETDAPIADLRTRLETNPSHRHRVCDAGGGALNRISASSLRPTSTGSHAA